MADNPIIPPEVQNSNNHESQSFPYRNERQFSPLEPNFDFLSFFTQLIYEFIALISFANTHLMLLASFVMTAATKLPLVCF